MVGVEKIGQLEDEALKRKARLQALRNRQEVKEKNEESNNSDSASTQQPVPKPVFRSYCPQDDNLKENVLPQAEPGSVEIELQDVVEKPATLGQEIDLASLAPRKPDWDLKRDVAKKLQRLERRTQKAIAELIRDRLQADQADLAQVVAAPQQVQQDSDED